jgi:hypothetical protein
MVETLEGIGNIDDLLAVEEIEVFFIGPGDLSQNMGTCRRHLSASPGHKPSSTRRFHRRQDPRRRQDRWSRCR